MKSVTGAGSSLRLGDRIGSQAMATWRGGRAMAQRGGPWRLSGYAIPDGQVARRVGAARGVETHEGERGLRRIVLAYVLAVIVGGLLALAGLAEEWW
jgi:hypothetical protein